MLSTLFYKQNVRACFEAKTMHTVNKNNFHRIYLFIYLLQNYNIEINTPQSNLYKSLYSQMQTRSQITAMRGEAVSGVWGRSPQRSKILYFFGKNNLILGLF